MHSSRMHYRWRFSFFSFSFQLICSLACDLSWTCWHKFITAYPVIMLLTITRGKSSMLSQELLYLTVLNDKLSVSKGEKMSQTGGTCSAVRITKSQLSKAKHLTVPLNLNFLFLAVLEIKMASYKIKADISLLMFFMYFKMILTLQPYAE